MLLVSLAARLTGELRIKLRLRQNDAHSCYRFTGVAPEAELLAYKVFATRVSQMTSLKWFHANDSLLLGLDMGHIHH